MVNCEGVDFYAAMLCGKGQKNGKSISVRFDGFPATAFYARKVLIKEFITDLPDKKINFIPFVRRPF